MCAAMTSCGDAPAGGALPLPPPPASVGDADDELARTSFVHAAAADADTLYGLECDGVCMVELRSHYTCACMCVLYLCNCGL